MRVLILAGAVLLAVAGAATMEAVVILARRDSQVPPAPVEGAPGPGPGPVEEIVPDEPVPTPPADGEPESPQPSMAPRPPEPRDARLFIRLSDEETGDPVAMQVHLWRLEVPEDERWTEGDVETASLRIPQTGRTVEDLVPGRYRFSCDGIRKGAEDPPSFLARSGDNMFEAPVRMPRTVQVHLRVYDEEGRPIERANCQTVIASRYSSFLSPPSWAQPRMKKLPNGSLEGGGISGGGSVG